MVPSVPRSVGCVPTVFPPKASVGHRAVHRLPLPVQALQRLIGHPAGGPEPLEPLGLSPRLTPVMPRTRRPQAARPRLPLAAGAQPLHDGGHRLPVSHPGPAVFLPGVGRGENAHHLQPEGIGNVILGAYPTSVITPRGFLLSGHGGTKYIVFSTFRIGSKGLGKEVISLSPPPRRTGQASRPAPSSSSSSKVPGLRWHTVDRCSRVTFTLQPSPRHPGSSSFLVKA